MTANLEPNALAVESTVESGDPGGKINPSEPVSKNDGEDWTNDLAWTIVGGLLIPFGGAVLFRGAVSGWTSDVIDAPNLASCLVALSLALFVRIVSGNASRKHMPWVLLLLIFQISLAWVLSGTFDRSRPSPAEIDRTLTYVNQQASSQQTLKNDTEELRHLQDLLRALHDNDHTPSPTFYIYLVGSGLTTVVYLVVLWAPLTSGRGRAR